MPASKSVSASESDTESDAGFRTREELGLVTEKSRLQNKRRAGARRKDVPASEHKESRLQKEIRRAGFRKSVKKKRKAIVRKKGEPAPN